MLPAPCPSWLRVKMSFSFVRLMTLPLQPTVSTSIIVYVSLDSNLLVPLKHQGHLTHYNGLDVVLTCDYITPHCGTYVRKILGWSDMNPTNLPMSPDNEHVRSLDTAVLPATTTGHDALESANFRYSGAIDELIWAMITCRPELSFPVVKLSQFSINPPLVHYLAVEKVFKFLSATLEYGLTYWQTTPHSNLPFLQPPAMLTNPADRHLFHDNSDSEHFSHFALFGHLIGPWIFATVGLFLALFSNLLVQPLLGNAVFNPRSCLALLRLNFLQLVMLESWLFISVLF